MKNVLILLVIVVISSSCANRKQAINNHVFIEETINKLTNKKVLIVEFWAPTCNPCIKLKNDIFENDHNKDFLNENFILVKISPNDSIYKSLFKYYNLNTQSTVLFFDKSGVEIDRSVGYNGNKKDYMDFLYDISQRKNLFQEIYTKYKKDSSDININYQLAKKYQFRYENSNAVNHFKFIVESDSLNQYGYKSECSFRIAEHSFFNSGSIEGLNSYINNYSNNEFSPKAYLYLINYYKKENDHKNSLLTSSEALRKYPINPDILNKHAWNIYLFKIKEDYSDAIEMISNAIKINSNNAAYWDTLAWLYFESGEISKAIISEQKAIEIFPHPVYKNALQQFESI